MGHSRSGLVSIVNSDCPIAHSEGTTSRKGRPDAAIASQISTIDAIRADAQPRHRAEHRRGDGPVGQSAGISHRSTRSVSMKNMTLIRITKQIAA